MSSDQQKETPDSRSRHAGWEVIPESTHQETFNALSEASRTISELQAALVAAETERDTIREALEVFLKTGSRNILLNKLVREGITFDKLDDQN
jgi:hypothetical protein